MSGSWRGIAVCVQPRSVALGPPTYEVGTELAAASGGLDADAGRRGPRPPHRASAARRPGRPATGSPRRPPVCRAAALDGHLDLDHVGLIVLCDRLGAVQV